MEQNTLKEFYYDFLLQVYEILEDDIAQFYHELEKTLGYDKEQGQGMEFNTQRIIFLLFFYKELVNFMTRLFETEKVLTSEKIKEHFTQWRNNQKILEEFDEFIRVSQK